MPSVAKQQDQFKLKTLEAMAAGQDPYGQAKSSVSTAEQDALAQHSGDVGGVPGAGRLDTGAGITTGSDAVQDYLGTMQGAQADYDRTFREASAAYAPPPIYSSGGSSGGGATGGLSADDLAIKPQVFPESYGGGLRYGGFRTQAEANAAVMGAAERYGVAAKAEDDKRVWDAAIAQALAKDAREAHAPRMPTAAPVRRPVVSRGLRTADAEAQQVRFAPRTAAVPRGAPAPADREAMAHAMQADMTRQRSAPRPVISRGNLIREEETNARAFHGPEGIAARGAQAESDAYIVPEDWELQRQAAMDWGFNPYIAEGLYDEPTAAERNAAIRSENELNQRLGDPEGYTPQERTAYDQALLEQSYGPDVVGAADRYNITPDDYLAITADPAFAQAAADAETTYVETDGNLDQVEMVLLDYGLSPQAIRMILDGFSGLGVTQSNIESGYEVGG